MENENIPSAFTENIINNQNIEKKRKRLYIIFIVIFALIIIIGVFAFLYIGGYIKQKTVVPNKHITLTMWGIRQPQSVYQSVINEYEKANPNVTIQYTQIPDKYYLSTLFNKVRSGVAVPDIITIGNTYLPLFQNYLTPAPQNIINFETFKKEFYPTAVSDLTNNRQIYGLPLEYDGLALMYNKQELTAAGFSRPSENFNTFVSQIPKLVVKNKNGQVTQAAIDIGTNTSNIYNASNILTYLMFLSGTQMTTSHSVTFANSASGTDALNVYNNIAKISGWNSIFPSAVYAFAKGDVAMIFAPSWQIQNILNINPSLSLGVEEPPQIPGKSVNLSLYFAKAVPRGALHPNSAWKFLVYLSSKNSLLMLFKNELSAGEKMGETFPRIDMANLALNYPYMQAFTGMAPTSKSWHIGDYIAVSNIFDQVIEGKITLVQAQSEVLSILVKIANGTYSIPPGE
ncbi:extracellular solute-binding protein [Patescibacteria group bacterium]|nr:extracellular solute-binding protein [Patescibacteria group bacterium]